MGMGVPEGFTDDHQAAAGDVSGGKESRPRVFAWIEISESGRDADEVEGEIRAWSNRGPHHST